MGGSTFTAWNRRSSDRSFSMYFRYSAGVVAPMQRISPRDRAGLRMFAASSEPSADPAPTSVCSSSMNTMMFGFSVSSFMIALRRSSNCPRYFVPATISGMSSARSRLSARKWGTSPNAMRCASPSTMAVLPTPGSPMSTALFFVRRHSTCCTRSSSTARPTSGSRRFFSAASDRSRLNSASSGVSLTRVTVVFSFRSCTMSSRTAFSRIPFSDRMVDATDRSLAQDAEQEVLGPDVVVQQPIRLLGGELQHALRLRAERDLDRRRHLLAEDGAALDFLADVLQGQARAGEDAARQPLALADQSEQQMLGFYRDAAELARLVTREEQDTPRPFGVSLEHVDCSDA